MKKLAESVKRVGDDRLDYEEFCKCLKRQGNGNIDYEGFCERLMQSDDCLDYEEFCQCLRQNNGGTGLGSQPDAVASFKETELYANIRNEMLENAEELIEKQIEVLLRNWQKSKGLSDEEFLQLLKGK